MKKRLSSLVMALMMIVSLAIFPSKANAYTAHTQAEALDWVRSMVGKSVDYDGVYGAQCVDLIKAYYSYLGVTVATGNGKDYATNNLPQGWTRVKGGTPQPGDILVFSGSSGNQLGHVAIYEADRCHYHQNFNFHSVEKITYHYTGLSNPYWGYIRPDWVTPHVHSYGSSVTKQPTCIDAGVRTYTCSCGSSYTESIPATGHSYVKTVVAPSFIDKGYTLHKCTKCNDEYKDQYTDSPSLNDDGWYYCDGLPAEVDSDRYTIEYNSIYEKTQKDSPGEGWTKTEKVKNEWQNSGSQYTSVNELATSDSRVLVREYYYHWCIPGAKIGSEGNYEQTSKFSHYDEIPLPNEWIHVTSSGNDNGHPYYVLAWSGGSPVFCKSGEQCDGTWGYHDYRCKAWYKHYVYQDRIKIELYKYIKKSGWTSSKESGATKIECRFKPKHEHDYTEEIIPATCTEEGMKVYTCSCGNTYTESVPATGHKYTVNTIAPSTTQVGYDLHTCSVCSDSYIDNVVHAVQAPAKKKYPVVTTEVQGRQFRLKWTPVDGAEKYGIAVFLAGKWKVHAYMPGNSNTYTSRKIPSGTYKVVLCARVNGEWDTSNINKRAFEIVIK
ncbi:CHAP domain-containing protein [Ruminococcus albus]|uniref:CHAP domain-containing protein n=1 Tax=Ruminococcus albus TaxID=1264 RepID=UPI000462FED1|nr:CHAP domain-containing protein [Ruminococcus albus]